MSKVKITQKILILLKEFVLTEDITFLKDTEFEIVRDVVYIHGLLVPPALQQPIYDFLVSNASNSKLFKEDFRRFK